VLPEAVLRGLLNPGAVLQQKDSKNPVCGVRVPVDAKPVALEGKKGRGKLPAPRLLGCPGFFAWSI
jgi:hypothetical protein